MTTAQACFEVQIRTDEPLERGRFLFHPLGVLEHPSLKSAWLMAVSSSAAAPSSAETVRWRRCAGRLLTSGKALLARVSCLAWGHHALALLSSREAT